MANARDLRKRRSSVANTRKITRTMELVASSKARKAQDAAEASRPYSEALAALVSDLAAACGESISHPLMAERPLGKVVVLVATSDRGLCGAFNANVLRHALEVIRRYRAAGYQVEVESLGKKGYSSLRFFGFQPERSHSGLIDAPKYPKARAIIEPLMQRFLDGDIDRVEIVYPRFLSSSRQVPTTAVLLPAGAAEKSEPNPVATTTTVATALTDYLYSPDPKELLGSLIPQVVKTAFFSALLQTSAGEHSARRMAMKNATDAASDLLKQINRSYNRARQTKITQEIAEIVGAVEAMS